MYRTKRAKLIKIIIIISFFLSYLPFILFLNYLSTLPQDLSLFNDCVTRGNSIFFPWFSSINLLGLIPIKENLIQFSLGNFLDIILFCNVLSYFDALLYHYFVKRIISERENFVEYNLSYYSQPLNNPDDQKRVVGHKVVFSSEDEIQFTIGEYEWVIKDNNPSLSFVNSEGFLYNANKLNSSFLKYPPLTIKNTFVLLSPLSSFSYYPFKVCLPSSFSLDFSCNNSFLIFPCSSLGKNAYILSFYIPSNNYLFYFLQNIKDFLPFYPYYVHTITPNYNRNNCDLELHFIHLCEILFLITVIYSAVIRNGIKQLNLNLKTKIVDD